MRMILAMVLAVALGTVVFSNDDLPVKPVKLGDKPNAPPEPKPVPLETEDPRDVPPPVFYGEELEASRDSIVYVIDGSRSMLTGVNGGLKALRHDPGQGTVTYAWREGGNTYGIASGPGSWLPASRWDRAVFELFHSVEGLANSFRFNVVVYNCVNVMFRAHTVQATPANKAALAAWITSMRQLPVGGTDTGTAVAVGLGERANKHVVLLTDGEPGCLVPFAHAPAGAHRALIRRSNRQRATIDVFGIAATGRWRAFCVAVASENSGHYYDVR